MKIIIQFIWNNIISFLNLYYMMNINILCKEHGEFYHFKCYVIWETYQMLPITHWLVKVQGIREDTSSNMFPLSTLNRWSFTKHTFWPSKPQLSKFSRWDSWAWIMSRKWNDVSWAWTMGFDEIILPWILDNGLRHHFV